MRAHGKGKALRGPQALMQALRRGLKGPGVGRFRLWGEGLFWEGSLLKRLARSPEAAALGSVNEALQAAGGGPRLKGKL